MPNSLTLDIKWLCHPTILAATNGGQQERISPVILPYPEEVTKNKSEKANEETCLVNKIQRTEPRDVEFLFDLQCLICDLQEHNRYSYFIFVKPLPFANSELSTL